MQVCTLSDDGTTRQCLLLQMYESIVHGCHLATQDMDNMLVGTVPIITEVSPLQRDHLDVV